MEIGDPDGLTIALTFELPKVMRLRAEQNLREHWAVTARRANHHRGRVGFALAWLLPNAMRDAEGYRVTMTRIIGPRGQHLDSDGLVASCKHVRDGIADALGIDDRSARLGFTCTQERAAFHGVRVIVRLIGIADPCACATVTQR